jgi:hypothetical protein
MNATREEYEIAIYGKARTDETCSHENVVDLGDGWGRCDACEADDFPMNAETAVMCESCGSAGEHREDCEHDVPPWAELSRHERWEKCGVPWCDVEGP